MSIGCSFAQEENHGILETHVYSTTVKGPESKKLEIYLPADYYADTKEYPVVYLLHGANGNESSWIKQGNILNDIDSLVLGGIIDEYIYVFPNTNRYYNDYDSIGSRTTDSVESYLNLNGSAEYSFIHDVVTYVERTFRTIEQKEFRAIAGLSLGALQSIYISANAAELFGYIGLFSPVIYPPMNFGKHTYFYRNLEDKLINQFSSTSSPTLYLIIIGKDDAFYKSAYQYSKILSKLKCEHVFETTTGGHTWYNWTRYCTEFLHSLQWGHIP